MIDTKADTWTKSSFYYDEPSDTCDRSFLISSVSREFPFQKTERRNWFEIKKSKSRDLHFQKSLQKRRKKNKTKKTHRSKQNSYICNVINSYSRVEIILFVKTRDFV